MLARSSALAADSSMAVSMLIDILGWAIMGKGKIRLGALEFSLPLLQFFDN